MFMPPPHTHARTHAPSGRWQIAKQPEGGQILSPIVSVIGVYLQDLQQTLLIVHKSHPATPTMLIITIICNLAEAFIQSDLRLIRLSRGHSHVAHVNCVHLIVATPGLEPPTFRVMYLRLQAALCLVDI